MDCKETQENLIAYHDHDLDEKTEVLIREHLAFCRTCRSEYEDYVLTWKVLGLWEDSPPPYYLRETILRRIKHRGRKRKIATILSAAAVILLVVGALFILRDMSGHSRISSLQNFNPGIQERDAAKNINEEDVIANLQLLQEKDFYENLDTLEKVDYLPLIEEPGGKDWEKERSSLESFAV